jgi:hypothetical protein
VYVLDGVGVMGVMGVVAGCGGCGRCSGCSGSGGQNVECALGVVNDVHMCRPWFVGAKHAVYIMHAECANHTYYSKYLSTSSRYLYHGVLYTNDSTHENSNTFKPFTSTLKVEFSLLEYL